MANINDYLLWRGDLPINRKYKFNEIDSMILARFSYLLFDKIDIKPRETIATISERMKDFDNKEFMYNGDKELITNLGKRFRNLSTVGNKEDAFNWIKEYISHAYMPDWNSPYRESFIDAYRDVMNCFGIGLNLVIFVGFMVLTYLRLKEERS